MYIDKAESQPRKQRLKTALSQRASSVYGQPGMTVNDLTYKSSPGAPRRWILACPKLVRLPLTDILSTESMKDFKNRLLFFSVYDFGPEETAAP